MIFKIVLFRSRSSLGWFVEAILAELHVEMFVYGDWQREQAYEMAATLKNT